MVASSGGYVAAMSGDATPRVVAVTGASAGLGRAIADAFANNGDHVALLARNPGRVDSAAADLRSRGVLSLGVPVDVADWGAMQAAVKRVEDELGSIDIWVNNAMASIFAPFQEVEMDEFVRATAVTYLGTVHGTKAALEVMQPRNAGVIVQVGSALAYRGIPLQAAYCGSKHAIVGFTESVRTELLHQRSGISITMVQMPAMNTPQFDWVRSRLPKRPQPVPPIYQPEVCARAVVFAADHPRRHQYLVGVSTSLTVLGNKVVPGLLDRYLGRTGYKSQQTDEPENPDRPDNLFESVPGGFGAHGRFDDRSHGRSPWTWVTRHIPR